MDEAYWLSRKRASFEMAKNAAGPEARLIHYELAGRYSLKAMSADVASQLVDETLERVRKGAQSP